MAKNEERSSQKEENSKLLMEFKDRLDRLEEWITKNQDDLDRMSSIAIGKHLRKLQ